MKDGNRNENMRGERGDEERDYKGGRDKGIAPPFRQASEIEDGENINVENFALGRSVVILSTGDNLTQKGEANFTGAFKEVAGRDGLINSRKGYGFVNESSERAETKDKGVD